MDEPLEKIDQRPEHPDRKTGYERILTDPAPPWFVEIYPGGDGIGFLHKMARHAVSYHERSKDVLLISFDNIANVNDRSFAREPWGWKFFHDQGYSHMGIFARTKAWYRDREIIDYLQARAAEGFFDQFGKVVLTGSSMGGFGALAFAPLIPKSTVIAFNPQSTLDTRLVPWEERYRFGQVQDWDLPFGDGAAGLLTLGPVYIIYDHFFEPDRQHANRLKAPNVTLLKSWFSNHFAAPMLRKLDMLKPVMLGGIDGTLTEDAFYQMFRARRGLPWYMRGLTEQAQAKGHAALIGPARKRFKTLRRAQSTEDAAEDESAQP
jgi:pimeloyl-ACP methyl ester carboxylesterase